MSPADIDKYRAVRRELESLILKKLEAIKEKVLTHAEGTVGENIQILTMVSDELDDVLLNWEPSALGTSPIEWHDDDDDY